MSGVPFYTDIVIKLLSEIDLMLNNYVFESYNALSHYLSIPLGTLAIIYIALVGYSLMLGKTRLDMGEFVLIVVRLGIIYLAVTQWGWVSKHFINLVNETVNALGDVLISAAPSKIPGVDGIDGAMQLVLIQFTKLGAILFQSGGISNLGGLFDGVILWIFSYVLVAVALFELIIAKVLLAIMFVFTPLMALFFFFKKLAGITERWLGIIIGAALLQLFVTAALTLSLSLAYWWLELHLGESALQIGNYGTLPIIIIGLICIGLILKSAQVAMYIGSAINSNGASTAILASMATLFAGWAGNSLHNLKQLKDGRILHAQKESSQELNKQHKNSLRSGD